MIRLSRARAGQTQAWVAAQLITRIGLNIDSPQVCRIERGERVVDIQTLAAFANVLQIPHEDVLQALESELRWALDR